MATREVIFEENLKIDQGVAGEYLQLIRRICEKLGKINENGRGFSQTAVALADVEALFDLILSTSLVENSVRFRFRTEDVYLIGFKIEQNGNWFAFEDTKELIRGSQSLGFNSSYQKLDKMPIGFQNLRQSIINLATGNDGSTWSHDLTRVIMFTSESLRFKPIAELMQSVLQNPHEEPPVIIETWVKDLVHNWEYLCKFVHLSNSKSGVRKEDIYKLKVGLQAKHLKVPYNFDRDWPCEESKLIKGKEVPLVELKIVVDRIVSIMGILVKFKDY
ncbi:hypothetical protein G4B88_019028 [Cannabis sativa]|uniref:rRNA N-glycosylase n=2 Tax=Cannabis sativa TaxID=3483 RepID=A0AB40E9V3_CANSA|nr:hypothetical protein G4B88_019028 [Cannabis sativa]